MSIESRSNDDWKQRFRAPIVAYTELAHQNPAHGLAVSNRSGVYQLHAWDVPSGELRQLTSDPQGQLAGTISPNGSHVYYIEDEKGDEIGHFVRVPFAGGEAENITPDMAPYACWSQDFSQTGDLMGFVAADDAGFHLYLLKLPSDSGIGERRALYHTDRLIFGPNLSYGGEIAVMATTERTGKPQYSLVALDTKSGEQIAELYDGPDSSIQPWGFVHRSGDFRLLGASNRTGENRPFIWNPRTRERSDLELGDIEGDVIPFDWSADGRRILLCQFTRAVQHLWVYDLEAGSATRLDEAPSGSYGFFAEVGNYFGPDGEIVAQWQDSTHPSQLIALDASTGRKLRTVLPAGDVPSSHPWKSVSFISADGREIQAWLAVPHGARQPLPAILETHGGPESVTTEIFAPRAQAWLDRGFAFMTVNYHGSTTFGREFQESIWGHPGELEVDDMVAARDWLVEHGIARPDEILVTGGSYGGYLTLQALGKRPDLWAGGMAIIPVADWRIDFEDAAETLRGYDVAFFGGTPEEKPDAYAASSPITYVENVRAPVLIIAGRNDTRCPPRQVEVYEARMKELGKPIEVIWFDAGHLIGQMEEAIKQVDIMLEFAHGVLQRTPQPAG